MRDDFKIEERPVERADTAVFLYSNDLTIKDIKSTSDFFAYLGSFISKWKLWITLGCSALLLITCMILMATGVIFSRFKGIQRDVTKAFSVVEFTNYPTIYGDEVEDHVTILSKALYLAGVKDYDVTEEVEIYTMFNGFNEKYARRHVDLGDKVSRFSVFRENYFTVKTHNANPTISYSLKLNNMADRTDEEFMSYLGTDLESKFSSSYNLQLSPLATKGLSDIDYREKGVMTPVRDQGFTATSWAYAVTSTVESHFKRAGKDVHLSTKMILDLASRKKSEEGSDPVYAYKYLLSGVYAYGPFTDSPAKTPATIPLYSISSYVSKFYPDILELLHSVGPVTSIAKVSSEWKLYSSGVINKCGTSPNHAVTVAGVGSDHVGHYYIVKNSWGADWGEEGYAKIRGDASISNDDCGLRLVSYYPVM